MKKILAIILAMSMLFSMMAFAEEENALEPKGQIAYRAYILTGWREAIQIDLFDVYAEEELKIELWCGDTHLSDTVYAGTYPLNKSNAYTTACVAVSGGFASWNNTWYEEPTVYNVPEVAKLYADGVLVSTFTKNGSIFDDKLNAYLALSNLRNVAEIDGVGYKTFEEAAANIKTDGSDTTVKLLENIKTDADVVFNYGEGNITFTADKPVTVKQTALSSDYDFTVGNDIDITVDENVTFEIYDNASGMYLYYGPSLIVKGKVTGGQNWGCLYLFNGEHVVEEIGEVNVGRLHIGYADVTAKGKVYTNHLLVEASSFTADGAVVDAKVIHDSNNGGMRWGESEFKIINGSDVKTPSLNLQYADSVLTVDMTSKLVADKIKGAGTIVIDAAAYTDGSAAPITGDASAFTGNIELVNAPAGLIAYIKDGAVTLEMLPVSDEAEVDFSSETPSAAATFYDKNADGEYEYITIDATFEDAVFTDEAGAELTSGVKMVVSLVEADETHDIAEILGDTRIYDIYFVDENGNEVEFEGRATVTIPVYVSNPEGYKVFHLNDEGQLSDMNATYDSSNNAFVFETNHFSQYVLANLNEVYTDNITIVYKATAKENEYEIYAVADDEKVINRLSSAQLKFAIENDSANVTDVSYDITAADGVSLTGPDADGYLLFNFDGTVADSGACEEVLLGKVTFEGYGKFTFSTIDDAAKAQLHTATVVDNIVVDYDCAASKGYDLIITETGNDTPVTDTEAGGKIETERKEATTEVKVVIEFNNNITSGNTAFYNDMTVTLTGANGKVYTGKVGNDADTADINYEDSASLVTFVFPEVVVGENGYYYTATVKGAGYRNANITKRLTADLTDDEKTYLFWNNVKDADGENFLAGDIVKDNIINIYDLSAVVSYFGETGLQTANPGYAKYDLNRDGKIDSKDVAYVLVSWGK